MDASILRINKPTSYLRDATGGFWTLLEQLCRQNYDKLLEAIFYQYISTEESKLWDPGWIWNVQVVQTLSLLKNYQRWELLNYDIERKPVSALASTER